MTTEDDLSPEADDVRRLLAEARHTEPMPEDVAARMDAVLADLARPSSTVATTTGAPVVSLSARRRRRAGGLLVAAAAIVVGGVAVAQQLPQHGPSNATAGSQDNSVDAGAARPSAGSSPGGETTVPGVSPPLNRGITMSQGRVVVRAQHFAADALAGRALLGVKAPYAAQMHNVTPTCVPAPAHSQLLSAVFRHAPAALVYHRPAGSTQVVDLFVCGSARPLKSVTLPTG